MAIYAVERVLLLADQLNIHIPSGIQVIDVTGLDVDDYSVGFHIIECDGFSSSGYGRCQFDAGYQTSFKLSSDFSLSSTVESQTSGGDFIDEVMNRYFSAWHPILLDLVIYGLVIVVGYKYLGRIFSTR